MKGQINTLIHHDKVLVSLPLFSIVIATYNRAELLKRALESLISQTETDWEALVVDDGSTDGTYDKILPFLKRCSQIKYIKKRHSGEASTKNEGVWSAKGKFISFLDSDDEYDPNHLASRKAILLENPEVNFLYGGVRILGNQFVPDRFDHSHIIDLNDCAIGGSFFIERKVLADLKGFREITLGTDADLFERAKKLPINMMEVNEPTYIYHHENEDSITNSMCLE